MKKYIVFFSLPLFVFLFSFYGESKRVITLMFENGYQKPVHYIEKLDPQMVKEGESLVKTGYGIIHKKNKPISLHFDCTHCHQLTVTSKKKLPASTLYGVVNRISWYNDDYVLKYGEGIKVGRASLRNAIQFCAQECAQGRKLEDNEVEAILHYLWSLELKTTDLDTQTQQVISSKEIKPEILKQSPFFYSKASFINPTHAREQVQKLKGNPQAGHEIYVEGCMSCHKQGGVTSFLLDESLISRRFLERNLDKDNKYNVYKAVYEGTWAKAGYRPYMPRYTKENMTFQEMADLIAYIKSAR